MARYFVTGFFPQGNAEVGVSGFITDASLGVYIGGEINNIHFDPTSSVSARQQIQDQLLALANTHLINNGVPNLTLVASDIEYIA